MEGVGRIEAGLAGHGERVAFLELLAGSPIIYEEEGIRGIEFPAGGRFIDILAREFADSLSPGDAPTI